MAVALLQEKGQQKHLLPLLLGLGYLAVAALFLNAYLLWDTHWLMALLLLPAVAQPGAKGSGKRVTLWLIVVGVGLLAAYLQNHTIYFMAFVLALWYGAQSLFGGIGIYPFLLLLVGSPIFRYITNILSFPLRLQLSEWAVWLLQKARFNAEAAGNIILLNGEEFSVDPACAGISMLSTALLLGIFILAHLQRKSQKKWPLRYTFLLLSLMVLLNLLANLLRILLLVLFRILPENPLHDTLGILCLLLYAVVPFYFISRTLHRQLKPSVQMQEAKVVSSSGKGILLLNGLLLSCIAFAGYQVSSKDAAAATLEASAVPALPGFQQEAVGFGGTKFTNERALVYVKPMTAFYATEHHPLICWEGSGYRFGQVQTRQLGQLEIYVGVLQKDNDTLYTAWWMDNGQHQTIDQLDWRWRMLQGEPAFRLVNVTVARQEDLEQMVLEVMGM